MKTLSIDIETFSSENLTKCGVYRYAEAPDFEVLLFGYSADGAPVKVVDLAAGETIPADARSALTDPAVTKWAFNAQFERVCLSRYTMSALKTAGSGRTSAAQARWCLRWNARFLATPHAMKRAGIST